MSMDDVALILPSSSTSAPDIETSDGTHLNHRASNKSLAEDTHQPRTFPSVGSFHSFLRPRFARVKGTIPTEGYEKLVTLDGRSTAVLQLGFAPKRGLLGEDTLRTDAKLAKLSTNLDACDKLQDLIKKRKGATSAKEDNDEAEQRGVKPKKKWTPRSMPRVSSTARRME
jgi:hypothetical protein